MYPIFHLEHSGSLEGYIKNIELLIKKLPENCKIIPGHGPLSNKSEFIKYHDMIVASTAIVKKGIRSGKTLEQIQKSGLPPQWDSFSHGYVTTNRWIAMLYEALKK
jgi:glyoxylase-like metal-dependent hydrolase (beta-lactamase superfamily II)